MGNGGEWGIVGCGRRGRRTGRAHERREERSGGQEEQVELAQASTVYEIYYRDDPPRAVHTIRATPSARTRTWSKSAFAE